MDPHESQDDGAAASDAQHWESFSPSGLRVLAVDDDKLCLKVISRMLQQCNYEVLAKRTLCVVIRELLQAGSTNVRFQQLAVTCHVQTQPDGSVITCADSCEALALLRDDTQRFDLVLSDVVMPDIDGFKLLEIIALEMDIPVIMMSYDGDTNTVLKGVTHGAVDFLIKPVRLEELRNMWQHVVRKRKQQCGDPEGHAETGVKQQQSSSHSSGDAGAEARARRVHEVGPSHAGGSGAGEARKRPHDDHDKPLRPNGKRPRVHWSSEMHSQFVAAVNKLGIDKAVPKKILELMSVEGLTRENVASHLQKYRLYLKKAARMDGTGRPPPGMPGVGGPAPPGQAQPGASHGPPAPPDQQFPPFMAPQGGVMLQGMPGMQHMATAPMSSMPGGYGYMASGGWAMAAPMQGGVAPGPTYMPQQAQYGMMPSAVDAQGMHHQDGLGGQGSGQAQFMHMMAPAHMQHQQQQHALHPQPNLMHASGDRGGREAGKQGDDVADVLTLDSGAGFDSQNIGGVPDDIDDFLSVLAKDAPKEV